MIRPRPTMRPIYQRMLLPDRSAMDHLLEAVRKIQAHSVELKKKA